MGVTDTTSQTATHARTNRPNHPNTHAIQRYKAPWWLPNSHLQTIWASKCTPRSIADAQIDGTYQRERWDTPDGDFIDIDFAQHNAQHAPNAPLLVLLHGLEGASDSTYAREFCYWAAHEGLRFAVPHFRGCSGEINRAPRAYHCGDHEEVDWILRRLRADTRFAHAPIVVVGISLGGNMLLRWAQEQGATAAHVVQAIAAVCSPIDLLACGKHIDSGINRHLYVRMFLQSMIPRAMARLELHPGLFDADALRASKTLYDFDNIFTAPLHGFKDTEDYWTRASSRWRLAEIQIPTLVLHANNDPFVPVHTLPETGWANDQVYVARTKGGGHVGFPSGAFPAHLLSLPRMVGEYFFSVSDLSSTAFSTNAGATPLRTCCGV